MSPFALALGLVVVTVAAALSGAYLLAAQSHTVVYMGMWIVFVLALVAEWWLIRKVECDRTSDRRDDEEERRLIDVSAAAVEL